MNCPYPKFIPQSSNAQFLIAGIAFVESLLSPAELREDAPLA
jgi:hypothetical protein